MGWLKRKIEGLIKTPLIRLVLRRLDAWGSAKWPNVWHRLTRSLAVGTGALGAIILAWPTITESAENVVTSLGGDPAKIRVYAGVILAAVSAVYTGLRFAFPGQQPEKPAVRDLGRR